jgi:GDP-D-mannose dehydratase
MSKTALITGATGQDGAYPAAPQRGKGYILHGITELAELARDVVGYEQAFADFSGALQAA